MSILAQETTTVRLPQSRAAGRGRRKRQILWSVISGPSEAQAVKCKRGQGLVMQSG